MLTNILLSLLAVVGFPAKSADVAMDRAKKVEVVHLVRPADTGRLVASLQSPRSGDRKRAQREIRRLAKTSQQARREVIEELVALVLGSTEHSRVVSATQYKAWEFAVVTLGELQATEAIGALIKCIDGNDGYGGLSLYHFPAQRALVMMGEKAVPNLTQALTDSRASTRRYVVLTLAEIGGEEARKSLERALKSEQDKDVSAAMKWALNVIASRRADSRKMTLMPIKLTRVDAR